jgi:hypothetical protein
MAQTSRFTKFGFYFGASHNDDCSRRKAIKLSGNPTQIKGGLAVLVGNDNNKNALPQEFPIEPRPEH